MRLHELIHDEEDGSTDFGSDSSQSSDDEEDFPPGVQFTKFRNELSIYVRNVDFF